MVGTVIHYLAGFLDSGVVYQNVERAELLHSLGDGALHVLLKCDVAMYGERPPLPAEVLGNLAGGFVVDIEHHNRRPGVHEPLRNAGADSHGGAGYDGDFIVEAHRVEPPLWRFVTCWGLFRTFEYHLKAAKSGP